MNINELNLQKELKKYFGLDDFRNGQEEIIRSVISGDNTIVVMPTGGGKSLCYQLPAVLMNGTCIVISPLIALMKDQVDSLSKLGIKATFINSSLSSDEVNLRINEAVKGNYKLLYIAPERISTRAFTEALRYMKISFLAVDEAHCISEWGHDFRPSYLDIGTIKTAQGGIKIAAFTATATPEIIDDISELLDISNPRKYIRGFDRPNLSYITEYTESDKLSKVTAILNASPKGAKIIYCGTRNKVDLFEQGLLQSGFSAMGYHAGLTPESRRKVQDRFINSDSPIIIATNAFGMGIDKPNVRAVIHCDLTPTIESYYQEAGRAGRDGAEASCYMLYHESDIELQKYFIDTTYPGKMEILKVYNALYDISSTPAGSKPTGPVYIDESRLSAISSVNISTVGSVLKFLENQNVIRKVFPRGNASVVFTASREQLSAFFEVASLSNRTVLEAILRSVSSDAFNRQAEFNLDALLNSFNLKYKEFTDSIRSLEYLRILKYIPPNTGNSIVFTAERLANERLRFDFSHIDKRREIASLKLGAVMRYTQTPLCKRNYILSYFEDEEYSEYCGKCSSCLSKEKKVFGRKIKPGETQMPVLQAVYYLDTGFGKQTLIDYVSGIKSDAVIGSQLEETEYFGVMQGRGPLLIEEDILKLIHDKYIAYSSSLYPALVITEKGMAFADKSKAVLKRLKYKPVDTGNKTNRELYGRLSALTEELSLKEQVTPASIIEPVSLRALAKAEPVSIEELKHLKHLSHTFIEKFGLYYIDTIKVFRDTKKRHSESETAIPGWVAEAAGELQDGSSVKEISVKHGMEPGTIANEISSLIIKGYNFNIRQLIAPESFDAIETYIRKNPMSKLRDIVRNLDISIDFATLRIIVTQIRKSL